MSRLLLKYSDFLPHDRPSLRIVPYFKGEPKTKLDCVLDSGADVTCISAAFAKTIYGLDLKKMTNAFLGRIGTMLEVQCICGKKLRGIQMPLMIRVEKYPGEIIFPVLVNWILDVDIQPVIGRKDFFECFDVKFVERKNEFILIGDDEKLKRLETHYPLENIHQLISYLKSR